MKWRPYPAYKPSGVDWLGDVPEHWEVKGLRYICRLSYGDSLPSESRESGVIGVYGSNGQVGTNDFANTTGPVIVIGRKGSFGKINYSTDSVFAIDTTYYIDSSCTKNSIVWLKYALLTLRLDKVTKDSAVPGLAREDAYENKLVVPPLPEQTAIADFLDHETGRIDTLVTKKQTLIERLKEKRTALISRTVTRGLPPDEARKAGLDPHPRLKPSGVEWLGDVPEHWEVKRLKHIGRIRYGLGEPPEYVDDGLPFIRATDIDRGMIDLAAVKRVSPSDIPWNRRPSLAEQEILIVRSGAYTGDSAIVPPEVADCIAGYDMVLTVTRAHAFFVAWALQSKYILESQIKVSRIRAAQPHLNAEELGNFIFISPSIPEQTAIADFLDRETTKIDQLIAKIETAIERLREYRTALITAAVTGKIDVRRKAA